MAFSTLWWIACGTAVAVELLTGTFYLLMLALGLAAGALAAHAGAESVTQIASAALIGSVGIGVLFMRRSKIPPALGASANKDVNLDIGESVHVFQWDDERNSTVHYRGADWQASLAQGARVQNGAHRIVEILGSRLILQPVQ